jgi:hypothetical protein
MVKKMFQDMLQQDFSTRGLQVSGFYSAEYAYIFLWAFSLVFTAATLRKLPLLQ